MRKAVATVSVAVAAGYVCDVQNDAVPVPSSAFPTNGLSPGELLAAAADYTSGPKLKQTEYTYTSYQDGRTMDLRNDCSCYLNYLTNQYLPRAYAAVPTDPTVSPPVPRARSWTDYFLGLASVDEPSSQSSGAVAASAPWRRVPSLLAAEPGDVLAYSLPAGSSDTGHVMIVTNSTDAPTLLKAPNDSGGQYASAWWVHVVDSSTVKHQNDTRCESCAFQTGVGSGYFKVYLGTSGDMEAFQFCETCSVHPAAGFALGRPVSF